MDDDEAAFFSRPKRKLDAPRRQLQQKQISSKRTKPELEAQTILSSDGSSGSESDSSRTTTAQAAVNGVKSKSKLEPVRGTKDDGTICLDTDSDDEPQSVRSPVKRKKVERRGLPKGRVDGRQGSRSRSDSLTPPPQLSPRRVLAGKKIIHDAFKTSSTELSSNLAATAFVPDAAELLFEEQMRERAALEASQANLGSPNRNGNSGVKGNLSRTNSAQVSSAPDTTIEIIIRGVYVALPTVSSIITDIKSWEVPRLLKIRLNMKLSIAKIGYCKEAGMCAIVDGVKTVDEASRRRMDDVVLVYRNVRIFDHSTPHDLGIADGQQPFFEAHTKDGWQYLEQHPELQASRNLLPTTTTDRNEDIHAQHQSHQDDPVERERSTSGAPGEFTRITLRAQSGKELKVRTRPTTKISSVVAGFRDKHNVPATAKVELRFEGETLSGTMVDNDVEDGDVIDVLIQ